jgi:hypothetical protein
MTRALRYLVLQHFLADLRLSAVADELGGCTATLYVFLQCTEELAVSFASVNVSYLCLGTDVELSSCRTIIDGGCVGVDIVCCDRLVASDDIKSGVLCLMMLVEYFAL